MTGNLNRYKSKSIQLVVYIYWSSILLLISNHNIVTYLWMLDFVHLFEQYFLFLGLQFISYFLPLLCILLSQLTYLDVLIWSVMTWTDTQSGQAPCWLDRKKNLVENQTRCMDVYISKWLIKVYSQEKQLKIWVKFIKYFPTFKK